MKHGSVLNTALFLAAVWLTPQTYAQRVQDMKLLTQSTGWAQSGQLLYWTKDGGASWRDISLHRASIEDVGGIFFLNESIGWALLNGLNAKGEALFRIASTADSGASWHVASLHLGGERFPKDLTGGGWLDFVDALHGWLILHVNSSPVSRAGLMFATEDGGQTWLPLKDPPIGDDFKFVNTKTGWLAGGPAGDELYSTRDGGASWESRSVEPPAQVRDDNSPTYVVPTFTDETHGFLPVTYPGNRGNPALLVLFSTSDGGFHWKFDRTAPNLEALPVGSAITSTVADSVLFAALASARKKELAIVPHNGVLRRVDVRKIGNIVMFSFYDKLNGWASGTEGLFSTKDGGIHWTEITPDRPRAETPRQKQIPFQARIPAD